MDYGTSYDTGSKPFKHDKNRGKWSSPTDFFFTCIGHAFKLDAILVLPVIIFGKLGIYALIPYFITLAVCVAPIVFIQSFLGQFSSTGFISVFRIAPVFKGIGYVSLAINLTTLTYYSVLGAVPLLYFFYSFNATIPWSCEGADKWMELSKYVISICTKNDTVDYYSSSAVPSVEYFKTHLDFNLLYGYGTSGRKFSWLLIGCTFIVWGLVGIVIIQHVEKIGKFVRYSCLIVIAILILCVLRLAFLPGASVGLKEFFIPKNSKPHWPLIPVLAFAGLGPGWGSILTMASYNNFKTNIYKYSWWVCLAQVGITLGLAFISIFATNFMNRPDPGDLIYIGYAKTQLMDFLIIPTGLTFFEWPHFWTLLFFGMLTLGGLNVLIVQLLSVLTSLFDEYETLRRLKGKVTLVTVSVLALVSFYFCSTDGSKFFGLLMEFAIMTQMGLNFLLLVIVLWIYGRERFQRDLHFMTGHRYSTWMVNTVKFVAPLFIIAGELLGLMLFVVDLLSGYTAITYFFLFVIALLPWCLVPGYCIYKIMQTRSGMSETRWKRSVRPTDWYPVEYLDKQRYDVALNNTGVSHPLTTRS